MSTITRFDSMRILARLIVVVLCVLCLQALCGCASRAGDEGVVDHAIKYASSRVELDMSASCVVRSTPDAQVEVSLLSFETAPDGAKEIKLVPVVFSDTMASWTADEWAQNRDDLFFNLVAHFSVICKQAHEFGDIPEGYEVTSPEYMVVHHSHEGTSYIVTSTGVYQQTNDPDNPIGEAVVLVG